MKKPLLIGIPLLLVLCLPLFAILAIVTLTSQAAECQPPTHQVPAYGEPRTSGASTTAMSAISSSVADECVTVATSCPDTGSEAEAGLTPDAVLVLRLIDTRFGDHVYHGVGERPASAGSDHATGRAVDIMIDDWQTPDGADHGTGIAEWVRANAEELGVTYVIWRAQIWSVARDAEDWRPYRHPTGESNPTLDHMDHVHVSVAGDAATFDCGTATGEVVYPVPAAYIDNDARNWRTGLLHGSVTAVQAA